MVSSALPFKMKEKVSSAGPEITPNFLFGFETRTPSKGIVFCSIGSLSAKPNTRTLERLWRDSTTNEADRLGQQVSHRNKRSSSAPRTWSTAPCTPRCQKRQFSSAVSQSVQEYKPKIWIPTLASPRLTLADLADGLYVRPSEKFQLTGANTYERQFRNAILQCSCAVQESPAKATLQDARTGDG